MDIKKIGVVLAVIIGIFLYNINAFRSCFVPIPICIINNYQTPCTNIEIEGTSYLIEIDLGSKIALALKKEILDKVKKFPCGASRSLDFQGNKYEAPAYFISNVKTGTLTNKKVKTKEESTLFIQNTTFIKADDCQTIGRIGRSFFSNQNLFLDFGNHTFIVCSHIKELKKAGYDVKNMIAVPFKNSSSGIILEIETDLGLKKFALDTGSTVTALRDLDSDQEKLPSFKTLKFSLGNRDFGSRKIYLLNISPLHKELDGFLGMDFLREHSVYLDFAKAIAYIDKKLDSPNDKTFKK